jgi:hypothetical protein
MPNDAAPQDGERMFFQLSRSLSINHIPSPLPFYSACNITPAYLDIFLSFHLLFTSVPPCSQIPPPRTTLATNLGPNSNPRIAQPYGYILLLPRSFPPF